MVNWLGFDPGGKCWPTKQEALESIPSITENKIYNIWPKYKGRHMNRHIFCGALNHKMAFLPIHDYLPHLSLRHTLVRCDTADRQQLWTPETYPIQASPLPYGTRHWSLWVNTTCLHSHFTSVVGGSKEMVCFRMSNYLRYQQVKIVLDTSNPSEETCHTKFLPVTILSRKARSTTTCSFRENFAKL